MTVHNYELLSSYDNNMKLYFYDNNKDDEDNQQYYLTFTAARRGGSPNENTEKGFLNFFLITLIFHKRVDFSV